MERFVGGQLKLHDIPAAPDLTPILARIRRDNPTYDYEALLEMAKTLHPEAYCIKHVPAAAVIESQRGVIFMFAINGKPTSTRAHLGEYQPDNLIRMAGKIPNDAPEREPLLIALEQARGESAISCPDLRTLSGSDVCLKGFTFGVPGRATRSSKESCPNSRAGCTERILLEWSRYALSLQEATNEGVLIIPDISFSLDNPNPVITYSTCIDGSANWTQASVNDPSTVQDPYRMRMMSQILPCCTCSKAIVDSGVDEVSFRELSQHTSDGAVLIDDEDVWAMEHMLDNGVQLICGSSNVPLLR
jgi:hypothetical protein